MTVLEILKPAGQTAVELGEDHGKRVPVVTARVMANRGLEFRQALCPGPFHAPFKVIPEKLKAASLGGVHDARLSRMQREFGLRRPSLHLCQRRLRLALRPA